jgi:hypothetical protein
MSADVYDRMMRGTGRTRFPLWQVVLIAFAVTFVVLFLIFRNPARMKRLRAADERIEAIERSYGYAIDDSEASLRRILRDFCRVIGENANAYADLGSLELKEQLIRLEPEVRYRVKRANPEMTDGELGERFHRLLNPHASEE